MGNMPPVFFPPPPSTGFTDAWIRIFLRHVDPNQRIRVTDPHTRSLVLKAYKGRVTFILRMPPPRRREVLLGEYPRIGIARARQLVIKKLAENQERIDQGLPDPENDPSLTPLRKVFEDWANHWLKQTRKNKTYLTEQFERHIFPDFADLPIREVKMSNVGRKIREVYGRSPRTATILLNTLKRVMSDTGTLGDMPPSDILTYKTEKVLPKPKKKHEGRALMDDEIALLSYRLKIHAINPQKAEMLWILLSCGMRIGSLCSTLITNIDLDRKLMVVVDEKKANQDRYIVPLSDFAAQRISSLIEYTNKKREGKGGPSKYLLPNMRKPHEDNHILRGDLQSFLRCRQASLMQDENMRSLQGKLTDDKLLLAHGLWRVHDLRRTAATIMQVEGISEEVRRACLNHKSDNSITKTYDRGKLPLSKLREAFNLLGRHLQLLYDKGMAAESEPKITSIPGIYDEISLSESDDQCD